MTGDSTLEQLFGEACFIARDDTRSAAARGRQLVALLGLPLAEQRRIRLEHLYGVRTAEEILSVDMSFGPFTRSRRPAEAAPSRRDVFP
ncbi:MAG: hypothetical protein ACHQ01_01635 [Candidatus Limnocylindrales bacterium]